MITMLARRFSLLLFVLFSLSLLAFSLSYLFPGKTITNLSGEKELTYELKTQLDIKYRTDQNFAVQYLAYLERIFDGDFGKSLTSRKPIASEIKQVFPATLELAVYALLLSTLIGIPLGIIAAIQHKKLAGHLILSGALIGYSLPVFWWALLAILLFSLELGWFPTSGRISLLYEIPMETGFILYDVMISNSPYKKEALLDVVRHTILPAVVLSTYPTTVLIRYTRHSMLNVLEQAYIKSARAKGLSAAQVLFRHGLRNALIPIIRLLGLQFSTLITLAMITEVIFSWPGIGRWLVESIYQRDYPAIQGGLLVVGTFVVVATMITDILYELFNPLSRKQSYGSV